VTKNLVVLIDAGASMTNVLSTQFLMETTYLAAAQSITQKALLQTLSAQDYVNIIVFNSTGATQLSPDPVCALFLEHHFSQAANPSCQAHQTFFSLSPPALPPLLSALLSGDFSMVKSRTLDPCQHK
jgi:hypothetical protein